MDSLPDVGKNEINVVNQQLVNRLKSTDTAFSLGASTSLCYFLAVHLSSVQYYHLWPAHVVNQGAKSEDASADHSKQGSFSYQTVCITVSKANKCQTVQ